MKPPRLTTILFLVAAWSATGQTILNISQHGKLQTGTTLPPSCAAGQLFLKTDAPPGADLYACTAANTWDTVGVASGLATDRPASCVAGQLWLAVDTGSMSYCSASGNPGTWASLAGSGSGATLCVVPLSDTPVFDAAQCNVFSLTLSNTVVADANLLNAKPGQALTFIITQDQTGGRSFVWPQNVLNACAVSATPGVSTILNAVSDGTNANATDCTTTDPATLITGPTRGAPGTPSSGLSCWFDSTGTWKCKDTNGNIHAAVLTQPAATANQFLTYIDGDGVAHSAPVSASQLSDGTTGSGSVVLTSHPTIDTPAIASFVNAQHSHNDAASGGQITEQALSLSDVTTDNATTAGHGFLPKLPGDNTKCLLGDGTYGACGSMAINGIGTWAPWEGAPFVPAGGYSVLPGSGTSGSWECNQWYIPHATKLANLFTEQAGDGSATDVLIVGVFNDSGSNAPGTKIANSEVVLVGNGAGNAGFQTRAWGPGTTVLPPGFYWGCYSYSSGTGRWSTSPWLTNSTAGNTPGHMAPPRRVKCSNSVTYNGAGTTLPASCTSPSAVVSNDNPPYIVITQ